ncbi:hypothetical protein CARUB_v10009508mg [Capsella rubella]|uniref:Uncharacterized protein n=1 Tax=Capsella rubella TaxID=81985 RepID=R0I6W6_9BRAS|nr:uncharacterized protein LOC17897854 [Capsella rubella]EOA38039.1 hypothetical protein CARUB_v10009508mg [Capsella rubella]
MANFYENYQIPYDFDQVNLYDHNNHYSQPQQEFGFEPMSYNNYNWNGSESEPTVAYSSYNPMSYNFYNWNGSETETNSASVAYSVSTMSEPKHLFYDPNLYTTYESPPQFMIHRSVASALDFNEPEFDDYDPTPYGGGYDAVATYGKPLPPSVDTCYPCSNAPHAKAPSPPEIIAPVPLGIYDGGQKNVAKKRVTFAEPVEEARPVETIKEKDIEKQEESEEEEEDEDDEDDDDDYDDEEEEDHSSSSGNEKEDHSSSYGTEKHETVVDKGEVKALYIPSGSGLEATDLCEVIFGGYFPCVLRNKRLQGDEQDRAAAANVSCWESNDSDPWKTTSDYLFGDSYPYGYENRTERNQFEISSYGYRMY